LLQSLLKARLLVEVAEREPGFVPARPPEQITAHEIMLALRAAQGFVPDTRQDHLRETVRQEYERIRQAEQTAASAVTLRDLATK